MKRNVLLVLFAGLLSATQIQGNGRGHFGAGKFGWSGRPGAVIGPGIGAHGLRGQGAFGFGFGRRGLSVRRSWPLYGWGLGAYGSQYYAPLESSEYDASLDSDVSPPDYYYQKPPESNIKPNCQDSPWAGQGSPSSLSSFMHKLFELQCHNRHPEGESKPSPAAPPSRN